jgi:hypothetical protein
MPRDLVKHATDHIEIETDNLDEIHDFLLGADVVEASPEMRVIISTLWPELLYKVKPPLSEMN